MGRKCVGWHKNIAALFLCSSNIKKQSKKPLKVVLTNHIDGTDNLNASCLRRWVTPVWRGTKVASGLSYVNAAAASKQNIITLKKNIKKTNRRIVQKNCKGLSVLDLLVPVQINTLLCIYIMRKNKTNRISQSEARLPGWPQRSCSSCSIIHPSVYMAFYFPPAKAKRGWCDVLLPYTDLKWCRNWNQLVPTDVHFYISELI